MEQKIEEESAQRIKKVMEKVQASRPSIFSTDADREFVKRLAVMDEHANVKPSKNYKEDLILTVVNAAMLTLTVYLTLIK